MTNHFIDEQHRGTFDRIGSVGYIGHVGTISGVAGGDIGTVHYVRDIGTVHRVGTLHYVESIGTQEYLGRVGTIASVLGGRLGTVANLTGGDIGTVKTILGGDIGSVGYVKIVGTLTRVGTVHYTERIGTQEYLGRVGTIAGVLGGDIGSVNYVRQIGTVNRVGTVSYVERLGTQAYLGRVGTIASQLGGNIGTILNLAGGNIGTLKTVQGGNIGTLAYSGTLGARNFTTVKIRDRQRMGPGSVWVGSWNDISKYLTKSFTIRGFGSQAAAAGSFSIIVGLAGTGVDGGTGTYYGPIAIAHGSFVTKSFTEAIGFARPYFQHSGTYAGSVTIMLGLQT